MIIIYIYIYIYPPPCPRGTKWSASNPLRRPVRARGVSGRLVLRAGGPPARNSPRDLFSTFFSNRLSTAKKTPKVSPERPKSAPTAPQMTQNPCPRHPKTDIFGLVKTLKNHCFSYGFGTFGRPRSDVLASKTALVEPTAQRPPKNRENVDQVVPKVAQRSQNGARKGRDF